MNRLVDIHTHRPCDGVLCPTFEGVHPWHALGAQIDHKAIAAADMVGETGLDYAADVDRKAQESIFRSQLSIAATLRKPVVIHCVRAFEPVMKILSEYRLAAVVMHGFTGSPEQAARALDRGYMLSFGMRTFSSPKTLRALHTTPLDRMFCETDDFPTPIGEVYRRIAAELGITPEALAGQLYTNYLKLFDNDE